MIEMLFRILVFLWMILGFVSFICCITLIVFAMLHIWEAWKNREEEDE